METLAPQSLRRLHLLGVCGTGMGSFAGLLAAQGYQVTGSDEAVYPPMSDLLKAWGIETMLGYTPENLDRAKPDLVVVGNVIRKVNPEATAVRERGLPQTSFPAALGALCIGDKQSVVVVGTHGKTTTTALFAHVLIQAGRDPSFLVGGVALNGGTSFRAGKGDHFVVEGDEYDTAYFDKGPKFLHYRPRTAIFTSMEMDHADIYADEAHYRAAFERFAAILPPASQGGFLAVSAAYPGAVEVARTSPSRVETYAAGDGIAADWTARTVTQGANGLRFEVLRNGQKLIDVALPMTGHHNLENALGVFAAATALGLTPQEIVRGLATFQGVRRRQEVRGEPNGILVIDDFAHHPTAVRETIAGVAARYPGRTLWALFEPRSNTSRRNLHQKAYGEAFEGASRVLLSTPLPTDRVPEDERLDVGAVIAAIRARGIAADQEPDAEAILAKVKAEAKPGDLLLVMSNGSFGGLIDKLLKALTP